ncbi:hypothetical protein BD410DRAFT_901168 [Rickenella mellea]|uniref:DUF6534 domain-containing protein n=1 Tax=Rickenella mellea TaxID=50990 RepID=A0A4Y7PQV0_9AGAM|nr:hypothetical protein BD410DRAFT_901168 [Rickenella mellea]
MDFNLASFFGPYFGAPLLRSCPLFGVTVIQTYTYFNSSRDTVKFRLFVGALFVLDIASTVFVAHPLYYYLVNQLEVVREQSPVSFCRLTLSDRETTAYTGIAHTVKCMVQIFFATRIYLVRKQNWAVPGIVVFFALASFALGLVTTYYNSRHHEIVDLLRRNFRIVVGTSAGFAVVSDVTATIAMCHFLANIPTEIRNTKSLRNSLLIFVINRGALVTVLELIYSIQIVVAPERSWWVPFWLTKNKMYINTTLAMLNSRGTLRGKATAHTMDTIRFADLKKSSTISGERSHLRQSVPASTLDPPSAVYDTQQFRPHSPTLPLHVHTTSAATSRSDPERIPVTSEC